MTQAANLLHVFHVGLEREGVKCFKVNQDFNCVHTEYVYATYCFKRSEEDIVNMTHDATLVHMLNVMFSRGQ